MVLRTYIRTLWWRLAAGLVITIFASPAAEAQSLFQSLFGFGSPKTSASTEASKPRTSFRAGLAPRPFSRWRTERQQSTRDDAAGDYQRDPSYGGSYRTVCVRTCDGFYWPVSQAVTRERFAADERRCDAGCIGEAKLYYLPKWSEDPREMVDLQGDPYTKLKNAFVYRRTLISGCGCRPAPWSVAESYRHHQYAAADAAKKAADEAQRQRAIAEALRNDKIAQIIAATEAAVALDNAELSIAAAEPETQEPAAAPAAATLTGYVHLHVLPSAAVELSETGEQAGTAPVVAALESAAPETTTPQPSEPAAATVPPSLEPAVTPARTVHRDRKAKVRSARQKSEKKVQTTWAFGGQGNFTWPGDAPRRAR